MQKFLQQERESINELIGSSIDDIEFKSFLESEYLSKDMVVVTLLMMSSAGQKKQELITNLATCALSSFINHYFKAVNTKLYSINPQIENLSLTEFTTGTISHNMWIEIIGKEPFFEWLHESGTKYFADVTKKLKIDTVSELAQLIRNLDYLGSFLFGYENDTVEIISSLYDLPIWLQEQLDEAGLLAIGEEDAFKQLFENIKINKELKTINYKVEDLMIGSYKSGTQIQNDLIFKTTKERIYVGGIYNAKPKNDRSSNPAA